MAHLPLCLDDLPKDAHFHSHITLPEGLQWGLTLIWTNSAFRRMSVLHPCGTKPAVGKSSRPSSASCRARGWSNWNDWERVTRFVGISNTKWHQGIFLGCVQKNTTGSWMRTDYYQTVYGCLNCSSKPNCIFQAYLLPLYMYIHIYICIYIYAYIYAYICLNK